MEGKIEIKYLPCKSKTLLSLIPEHPGIELGKLIDESGINKFDIIMYSKILLISNLVKIYDIEHETIATKR